MCRPLKACFFKFEEATNRNIQRFFFKKKVNNKIKIFKKKRLPKLPVVKTVFIENPRNSSYAMQRFNIKDEILATENLGLRRGIK